MVIVSLAIVAFLRRLHRASALLLIASVSSASAATPPDTLYSSSIGEIRDLHYGEVLFHHYQEKYFEAAVNLLVAQERERLLHHADDAELLLGGLKLSYGMHLEAEQIFRELLSRETEPHVYNRAWHFLGKLLYKRGYFPDAASALERVDSESGTVLDAENRLLRATISLRLDDAPAALELLQEWESMPREWRPFGQYNLGIAHSQSGDLESALEVLTRIARMPPTSDEVYTLRDKANLAIGYRLLDAGEFDQAKAHLSFVRLEGPYSNRALLGSGWTDSESGNFELALTPWLNLSERDPSDPSVQEALLAAPYAFGELGAYAQAAQRYDRAIAVFEGERGKLDSAIESVQNGSFLRELLPVIERQSFARERPIDVGSRPGLRYFPDLIATHEFQESFKNLSELASMRRNLQNWQRSVVAFEAMVDTREQRYLRQLPLTQDYVEQLDLENSRGRYRQWRDQFEAAVAKGDLLTFADVDEQRAWQSLSAIDRRFNDSEDTTDGFSRAELYGFTGFGERHRSSPHRSGGVLPPAVLARQREQREMRRALGSAVDPQLLALYDKAQLLRGVLQWKLQREYFARKRQRVKNLDQLGAEIERAESRLESLGRAQAGAPAFLESLSDDVSQSAKRVDDALLRLRDVEERLQGQINELAIARLTQLQTRIDDYLLQARYSLAQVYDRAASEDEVPEEAPEIEVETVVQ